MYKVQPSGKAFNIVRISDNRVIDTHSERWSADRRCEVINSLIETWSENAKKKEK